MNRITSFELRRDLDPTNLGNVNRCPHCSVAHPLLQLAWQSVTRGASGNSPTGWGAFICSNCGGVIAARAQAGTNLNVAYPYEIFPKPRVAHEDVPEPAKTFLQQAIDTLHAPDAAAVMAGSAVDAMLKNVGLIKGSLYERIDQALEKHILTTGMAEWAHTVRLGSNRPRHSDPETPHVSADEAQRSVDFAEALGTFLFVLTAQIERSIQAAAA
jgi:Domain of unknown function (DUF4145)